MVLPFTGMTRYSFRHKRQAMGTPSDWELDFIKSERHHLEWKPIMPGDGPLMPGDGPLMENYHNKYGIFCHFMVKLYLNNWFTGLIDFFRFGFV